MSQKVVAKGGNPWRLLAGAYFVAFLVTLVASRPWRDMASAGAELRAFAPAMLLLGIACVGIEGGYLMAYKWGWNVSALWLHTVLGSGIAVLLLGTFFFHEAVTMKTCAGFAVAIVGLAIAKLA